ncbi:hypothetical protein [Glycomyces salinus]|uniref:hypothetical protein n=1 Tax=Glycomyces salinus TaxID=980294 RepID=UPI0018EDC17B|nr:hypothetical protein [Glycomyces salinus]
MADMTDAYCGEFRRGPAVFCVFRFDDETYRVEADDGNGPSPVCRLTDDPKGPVNWHGAWNGDRWCSWIEAEARKVIKNPE